MALPDPKRIVAAHLRKTAGEVRFVKDRGGDKSEWGWNSPGPSERDIDDEFVFNPKYLKPLATVLRSILMALGHATSAHSKLVKIKSRTVSPDGNLGGKGYIQKVTDMRRQLMNCVEVLSASSDTLYDEINAPHWSPVADELDARDRDEVKEIVEDVEEIKDDPEGWAEEQEEELDEESETGKTAAQRLAARYARQPDFLDKTFLRLAAANDLLRSVAALENDPTLISHPKRLEKLGSDVAELAKELSDVSRALALVENPHV